MTLEGNAFELSKQKLGKPREPANAVVRTRR